jgi:hypothetical protein
MCWQSSFKDMMMSEEIDMNATCMMNSCFMKEAESASIYTRRQFSLIEDTNKNKLLYIFQCM